MLGSRSAIASSCLLALVAAASAATGDRDETRRELTEKDLTALAWRSVGPANMGGRVATIALAPGDPSTYFVGYATGGVWKTTNRGTTFKPVFDKYETSSIGAIAVCDAPDDWAGWKEEDKKKNKKKNKKKPDAKPDPDRGRAKIVWVGTGEGNGRNSSSWGHGVYRSTDGGAEFTHTGLSDSHDIPALAVDPRDPDVCYVAALGHLWGANEERGVYKTNDGGKTWKAVLQIDEHTGACDVHVDPEDPDTVYAAMYMRRRAPHSYRSGGPEGGIYRSDNGGKRWKKLTEGLPAQTGRIGIDVHDADPKIVFAVVESDEGGWIVDPFNDRSRTGGVFRSGDRGDTWTRVSDFNPRSFYFSRVRVDPANPDRVYLLGWSLYVSDDGGRTFFAGSAKVPHVDFHAMVIDPDDTDHLFIGTDGGLYESHDRGKTWDFHNHMAVGQFYNVAVDLSDPYRIAGGLQDNGTWVGPSETITRDDGKWMGRAGGITNQDWVFVSGGDGFHVAFDPGDPHTMFSEWQGGNLMRVHLDTGQYRNLRPSPKEGEPRFRFNWNAPFFISPHDSDVIYHGGNCVFRLTERGERWERLSDDLSTRDLAKITTQGSEAETAGTVVSLAESPVKAGVLWAGTDDGRVHLTTDGGTKWKDVTPKEVNGLYISKIEPSHHAALRAYVAVDGHRSDVFEPILLMTENGGASWGSIRSDLPDGAPAKVVREDPVNPDVLYVGTERAAYVTIDRGQRWVKMNNESLPTVAVDDLAFQPREMDLVAGTHGRSVYVLDDVSPLSQLTDDVVQSEFHVFAPRPGRPRHYLGYGGLWGDRMFVAKNPPMGAAITYWIRDHSDDKVKITIKRGEDDDALVVRKLDGTNRRGLNRVTWDLQAEPIQRLGNPHELTEFVPPGTYTATVSHGKRTESTTLEVEPEPGSAAE